MFEIIEKISYFYTALMMVLLVSSAIFFNVTPFYLNWREEVFSGRGENVTKAYSVYYSAPGFDQDDHFWLVTFANVYFSFCCATGVCAIDLYVTLMVFQVLGHIVILNNNLKNLNFDEENNINKDPSKDPYAVDMFSDAENKDIKIKLIQCIEHYKEIINFTDKVSAFFGPVLAIAYMSHLVICCMLLLECSQMNIDVFTRYLAITITIFGELIQLSVIFELVSTLSEKLIDKVYEISWERMNSSNRRTVCFMLRRIQAPIEVIALGITPVGVKTMAGILKTTFSYFALLRSMAE